MAVNRTVSQLQLYGRQLLQTLATLRHFQSILLCHREIYLHRWVVRNSSQHRGCIDERTHFQRQRTHHTGSRTLHITETQRLLGRSETGLGLGQLGLRTLVGVSSRLQLEVTDDLVLIQFLGVLIWELRRVASSLRRVHGSLHLAHLRLIRGIVKDEEYLSSTYSLTFLHVNLSNKALHLGANLHILHTLDRGRIGSLWSSTLSTNSQNWVLIVSKCRSSTTTLTTWNKQQSRGSYHQNNSFLHNFI